MATAATGHKSSHREINMHVCPRRCAWFAKQTLLIPLVCFERNHAFMLPLAERHFPDFAFDISRVKRIGQNAIDLLIRQVAVAAQRKLRMRFEEAFQLRLRGEAPTGETFQPLADDRRHRLVTNKNASAARTALIAIAERRIVNPISVEHSRPHPVLGLLSVFAPRVLSDACKQMLDKHAI
nr:hypothetical protein [Sphingobium lignivorans]